MSITGPGSVTAANLTAQTNMFTQLTTLSQELGTGEAAQTYSGLGSNAGVALELGAQLSAVNGYSSTATNVGTTLSIAQSVLGQLSQAGSAVSQSILQQGAFTLNGSGQTTTQQAAAGYLSQILDLLNTQVGSNYMFSGSATNQPSVASANDILNGSGGQAGLEQVIAERLQADQGSNVPPLGRLVISPVAGSSFSIGEDVAGSPFGFKLGAVNSSLTGATVTGPSGAPATISVNLGATNPNPGDSIAFSLNLPDGTSQTITLQATASATPSANQFAIGPTPAATAANLQTALTTAVQNLAQTALPAASAIAAANNFFSGETQVTGTNNVNASLTSGTPSTQSTAALTATGFSQLQNGDTLTFTLGGTSFTATYVTGAPVGDQFTSLGQLQTLLNTAFNGQAVATLPATGPDAGGLVLTSDNLTENLSTGGVNHIASPGTDFAATNANITPGSELTIGDGTHSATFYYVAGNASAANGTFSDLASLIAAVNSPASSVQATISASNNGGGIELTSPNSSITVGGTIGTLLGFAPGPVDDNVSPPLRVAGPPFDTATALVAGTAANTVFWYTGENGATPALQTATAQVGPSMTIAYGMRATEPAITSLVANVAALAATTYSASNPNAQASYQDLSQSVLANLNGQSGTQSISDIETDIANAQTTVKNATTLNTQTQSTLQDMVQGFEGVNQDQIGEQILTLQNTLSASMSVTARLAQLSLVNYLSAVSG